MNRAIACLVALAQSLLVATTPALAEGGRARAGDGDVSWSVMKNKIARSAEAARHGVDVATLKMMLGRSVYVNKAGQLAGCTISAIEKGFCGKAKVLSVEARATIARDVLEASGKCRWTGFDQGLNARLAQQNGAASSTLWLVAGCR